MRRHYLYYWLIGLLIPLLIFAYRPFSYAEIIISQSKTIASTDTSYDNQSIIVKGCTLTVEGTHQFQSISLINNATSYPSANSTSQAYTVDVTVTNNLSIESGQASMWMGEDTVAPMGQAREETTIIMLVVQAMEQKGAAVIMQQEAVPMGLYLSQQI